MVTEQEIVNKIFQGSALEVLKTFPEKSIQMCVTSPPYWNLRDYEGDKNTIWGGDKDCEHDFDEKNVCKKCKGWVGQLGQEPNFDLFVEHLCDIFDEVKRVLKDDGTCWVNLGDTYFGGCGGPQSFERDKREIEWSEKSERNPHRRDSKKMDYKAKCLTLVPFRFAIEMINRGWVLRNVIIWHKRNCMPSSVKDRFSVDFEYLFFFSKKTKYYFETQREPHTPESLEDLQKRAKNKRYDINYQMKTGSRLKIGVGYGDGEHGSKHYDGKGLKQYDRKGRDRGEFYHPEGRNKRTVWTINPKPFGEGVCEHCGHYSKPAGKVEKEGFFGGEQNVERICEACRKPMTKTHFACVSEDTECLTINGWKKYNKLKTNEQIASYDLKDKKIKWTPLTYLKKYRINQKIIHIGNRDLDILMTPNHRNVVFKQHSQKEEIVLAKHLAFEDKIKVSADFKISEHNSIGKTIAELLGWIISEGHYQKDGGIYIYQNDGKKAERIRYLLKNFSFKERKRKKNIEFYLPKLTSKMFKSICPEKRLTRELAMLPIKELKRLFKGLIEGDGHTRKDKRISFFQKDKQTVDWFSIIAMRLGYHPTISKRKDNRIYEVYLTKRRYIGIRNTNGHSKSMSYVNYKGIVWCPKTKYGTWVARRNGRIFITGNTFPEELIETPIKAGCPENGIVLDCFFGSGTTGMTALKLDRKFVGIDVSEEYVKLAEARLKPFKEQKKLFEY